MRAFIAIELPDNIKEELSSIQSDLKTAQADVKWVKTENIHLTLKFLGEVSEVKITEIKTAIDRVSKDHKKFETSLFKAGAFPKIDNPRVIWVGIDRNCSLIEEIALKIDEECEKLGFKREERQFSAHLTIGRVRSGKNKDPLKEKLLAQDVKEQAFTVDKLTLFQSTLTPSGPIYTSLYTAPLA